MEKLFLVCEGCGEAFDSLEIANDHEGCAVDTSIEFQFFVIKPESEAF